MTEPRGLIITGILTQAHIKLPEGINSLVLLSPYDPEFWDVFTASSEFQDGKPHPMDRWSRRVITQCSKQMGGTAFFPFDGPPFHPFQDWAKASGQAFTSPIGLLVHSSAGLLISYRGAIGFTEEMEAISPAENPCDSCNEKPCLNACPVEAFSDGVYNVTACKTDLEKPHNHCLQTGCAARLACPISQAFDYNPERLSFHMQDFRS